VEVNVKGATASDLRIGLPQTFINASVMGLHLLKLQKLLSTCDSQVFFKAVSLGSLAFIAKHI
jgi:hypothetical protein